MPAADPVTELDPRFSAPGAVATPWEDVRRAVEEAQLFWISTVRPDGRPHVTPLPAVWWTDALYFCMVPASRKVSTSQRTRAARSPRATTSGGQDSTSWSRETRSE